MRRNFSSSCSDSNDKSSRNTSKKRAKKILVVQQQQVQQQEQQQGNDSTRKEQSYSSSHTDTYNSFYAPSQQNTQHETSTHRYRDLSKLYTCKDTYVCATTYACIPCSYKIGAFDVALDTEFTQAVPNIRPEMCKRLQQNSTSCLSSSAGYGYSQGMKILTVGDGDFSFSLAVARIVMFNKSTNNLSHDEKGKQYNHRQKQQQQEQQRQQQEEENGETCLVATSYESFDTLRRVYPDIQKTLDELEDLNVIVCFNVDATDLLGTLPVSVQKRVSSFHRMIWNFPCTAIADGQDGQNQQMQDNQMLVRNFVKQCENLLHPTLGEIHFLHKTKPPYDQWKLDKIAVQDLDKKDNHEMLQDPAEKGSYPLIVYTGRVVFDRCLLLPYIPRKALDKKSFPCHDACLFVFGWRSMSDWSGRKSRSVVCKVRSSSSSSSNRVTDRPLFPPTIPIPLDLESSSQEDAVLPVTKQMIDEIRGIQMKLGCYKDRKKRKLL
jgi:25S rRNA (uracil2634-N3)-methyltransferase